MAVIATYFQFSEDGRSIGGGEITLPDALDWMPIEVKDHWFRYMGQGDAKTRYVLFKSQGEQRLLTDVSLRPLSYDEYKEKRDGASAEIERYIQDRGISRVPRNQ